MGITAGRVKMKMAYEAGGERPNIPVEEREQSQPHEQDDEALGSLKECNRPQARGGGRRIECRGREGIRWRALLPFLHHPGDHTNTTTRVSVRTVMTSSFFMGPRSLQSRALFSELVAYHKRSGLRSRSNTKSDGVRPHMCSAILLTFLWELCRARCARGTMRPRNFQHTHTLFCRPTPIRVALYAASHPGNNVPHTSGTIRCARPHAWES